MKSMSLLPVCLSPQNTQNFYGARNTNDVGIYMHIEKVKAEILLFFYT